MSEELKEDLIDLGLQRYVSAIINAGFDDWSAVEEMTESDFDALNIRLGDRRKLQREIARRQLWPENSPLPTPDELRDFTLSQDDPVEDSKNGIHHLVSEAEVMSPTVTSSPARDTYPFYDQAIPEGYIGETPESSSSIPTLELDSEMNDYEEYTTMDENNPSYLSAQDLDSDDDITPRAIEAGAVSPTSRPIEKSGNCIERVR